MKSLAGLLALPANLLALTLSCHVEAYQRHSPFPLGQAVKHLHEDGALTRRDLEIERRIASQDPIGVKKMGNDPGEKFYMHYWDFGEQPAQAWNVDPPFTTHQNRREEIDNQPEGYANESSVPSLHSPYLLHTDHDRGLLALFGRNVFGRDFQCPSGTSSCSSLGQSDLCCPNGQSCVETSDGVGCCPAGATCGDQVAGCDTSAGYTSCSGSSNGGCCVPGASCLGTGCVFYGTQTVTTTLPTVTVTTGVSTMTFPSPSPSTSTPSTPQVIVSGYTTTATVTITGEGTTQIMTVTVPTTVIISSPSSSITTSPSTCSTGSFTCPASLGGGCCANGQACVTGGQCQPIPSSTITTTVTPSAAVRPTSDQTSSQTSVSIADTTGYATCPTGFYMCSAVYLGGCCRVNRNCDSTSCPAIDSTDVVTSGLTIAAPTATAATAATGTQGTCATGWYSCAAAAGGGCCPSGYLCGASCTATVSGVSNQPKETPSKASVNAFTWSFMVLSIGTMVGMIWL